MSFNPRFTRDTVLPMAEAAYAVFTTLLPSRLSPPVTAKPPSSKPMSASWTRSPAYPTVRGRLSNGSPAQARYSV